MRKNISILGIGTILKYGCTFLSFIILARSLQSYDYGAFLTIISVVGFLSAFSDWGSYSLIIRELKNDVSISESLGSSIFLTFIITPVLLFIIYFIQIIFFSKIDSLLFLLVGISEFIGVRFSYLAGAVFLAKDKYKMQMYFDVFSGIVKVFLVLILYVFGYGFWAWIFLYSIGTLIVGLITLFPILYYCKFKIFSSKNKIINRFKDGSWFALSQSAQSIYFDFNNGALSYLKGLAMAGNYGAAFRFINISMTLLGPITTAYYPKLFAMGKNGYLYTMPLCKDMLKFTLGFSFIASFFLYVGSFFLPTIIGSTFKDSSPILRWMIPILILQAIYIPFFNAMNASNLQKLRTKIQFLSILINLILCMILIPLFSWKGAIFSTVISQFYIILECYFLIRREYNFLQKMGI